MSESMKYDKFTLKFYNPKIEAEFRKEIVSKIEYSSRIGLLIGGLIYLSFIFLDSFNEELIFNKLLINRLVISFTAIATFGVSFTSFFKRNYLSIVVILFFITGGGALYAMIDRDYISSVYTIVIFFNLIPFLTFPIVLAVNSILFLMFISSLNLLLNLDVVEITKHSATFFAIIQVSILAFYVKQSLERRNFIKEKKNKAINKVVKSQLKELEITHKNITDSINYAKRIQDVLLPSDLKIKVLPIDLELFYKPKDTIGGDFYWVEDLGDVIVVAIGDCTGHGVPGALMTSLGINGLINSVTEQRMTDPSQILTYLDDYIFGLLSETKENRVKDGMEIGIVCIDKSKGTLSFSSAGRPLVYVDNNEIHKIKATKRDIGSKLIKTPYQTEVLKISSTATYYLFSDGMTDQFGGERNKRLGSKSFNNLLLDLEEQPLLKQKEEVEKYYKHYMRNTSQTDDMIWGAMQIKK